MSLLDDIPGYVDSALQQADMYRSAVLTKVAPGTRTPGNISGGTNPTTTSYPCRGFLSGYDAKEIALANTLIESGDRMIKLLGASLPAGIVPDKNDQVTMQDVDGVTRTFRLVTSPGVDSSATLFTCQGRK